jgi:hypothetical protein
MLHIATNEDLEAAGPYAWPGGYPILYLGADGAHLCYLCAQQSLGGNDPTLSAMPLEGAYDDEDELCCDNCGEPIDLSARNH